MRVSLFSSELPVKLDPNLQTMNKIVPNFYPEKKHLLLARNWDTSQTSERWKPSLLFNFPIWAWGKSFQQKYWLLALGSKLCNTAQKHSPVLMLSLFSSFPCCCVGEEQGDGDPRIAPARGSGVLGWVFIIRAGDQRTSTDLATVWEMWRDLQIHFVGVWCWRRVGLTGRAGEADLVRGGAQHTKHLAGDVGVGLRGEQARGAAGEGQVGDAVSQVGCGASSDTQIVLVLLIVRSGQNCHNTTGWDI